MNRKIKKAIQEIKSELNKVSDIKKISIINEIQTELSKINPIKEPIANVQWVYCDEVIGNDYNPNKVAPPEMKLLELSILQDGFTQPIVGITDNEINKKIVIDGFHRNVIGKTSEVICNRMYGHLPLVILNKDITSRMASTIRHNRARGTHEVTPLSKIVEEMYFRGWSDKKIREELGMDKEELLRMKQFTGLGSLFEKRNYSKSWY